MATCSARRRPGALRATSPGRAGADDDHVELRLRHIAPSGGGSSSRTAILGACSHPDAASPLSPCLRPWRSTGVRRRRRPGLPRGRSRAAGRRRGDGRRHEHGAQAHARRRRALRPAALRHRRRPGTAPRCSSSSRAGGSRVVRGGKTLPAPFLDIRELVQRRRRAGAARRSPSPRTTPRPAGSTSTTPTSAPSSASSSTAAPAPTAPTPDSARLVLRMDDPEANHNGGLMMFGPDRLLYIGTGDGGGGNDQHGARGNAQDLGSLLGKLLRIDPRASGGRPYAVPAIQPVRRSQRAPAGDLRPTACATRGASPSTATPRDLSIGDVGQNEVEEIDFVEGHRGAAPTSAGGRSRATGATSAASPPRAPWPPRSPRRTRATAGARSPAATWCATPGCARCAGSTSSATSARGASAPRG